YKNGCMFFLKLLPVLALFISSNPVTPPAKWTIEKSSTITVTGKSNVNEFNCQVPGYYQTDTIFVSQLSSSKDVRLSGELEVDVFKFDCHSKMITKDLRKTLKADQYPKLKIRFLTLERLPDTQFTAQCIKGMVEVELAGERKVLQIPYVFVNNGTSGYLLNGTKVFNFSDFKLTPPKKLAGIVQVKDEFLVDFKLKVNIVP
ncbi:MAG TPA: hypothetical protein VJ499_06285, partial [Flavisolibacter sp.]|nr:hypothetical protein [Flavisolibacter sp.]